MDTFLTKYNEQDAFDEILHLSPEEERFEFMMMGLRMKDGFLMSVLKNVSTKASMKLIHRF